MEKLVFDRNYGRAYEKWTKTIKRYVKKYKSESILELEAFSCKLNDELDMFKDESIAYAEFYIESCRDEEIRNKAIKYYKKFQNTLKKATAVEILIRLYWKKQKDQKNQPQL